MNDARLALFLLLGQTATRSLASLPSVVPPQPLRLSDTFDLAVTAPEERRLAWDTAEPYQLFFVFERYLREFVVKVLSKDATEDWWAKIPKHIQDEVQKLEDTEETKQWMAIGSRDRSSLMTYPQLLSVIDTHWKDYFEDLLRDKSLIQEGRWVSHLRNAVCHMTVIPDEELQRIRQVMRDWFRIIPP
jgi:hypothetical protein